MFLRAPRAKLSGTWATTTITLLSATRSTRRSSQAGTAFQDRPVTRHRMSWAIRQTFIQSRPVASRIHKLGLEQPGCQPPVQLPDSSGTCPLPCPIESCSPANALARLLLPKSLRPNIMANLISIEHAPCAATLVCEGRAFGLSLVRVVVKLGDRDANEFQVAAVSCCGIGGRCAGARSGPRAVLGPRRRERHRPGSDRRDRRGGGVREVQLGEDFLVLHQEFKGRQTPLARIHAPRSSVVSGPGRACSYS